MSFFGGMGQSAIKNLGNGGTMDGDVTVTGDLTVNGGIALTLSEVLQGTSTIDVNNTEALLVRKNGDGGDVFIVDTTNSRVGVGVAPTHNLTVNNQIGIKRDGTDAYGTLTFDGSGFVIDQSTSGYAPLKIKSNGTEVARFTSTGLGIGTSSPSTLLNLESATSTAITAENTGNGAVALNLDANRSGADQGLGNINFKWNGTSVAQISGASGADTTNKDDGQIQFSTMSGGSSSVNMTLDKDGSVGIGTTTPSSFDSEANNLVVGNGSGDNGITIFTGSSAGHHGSIFFGDATGTPKQGQIRYEQNNEVMSFHTNATERMRIDLNGKVGIGTSSPSVPMHIYANDTTKWQSTIEQDGAGDASLKFSITGARDWLIGVDNSDGDKFKISYDANDLNDLTTLTLDTSGNVAIGTTPNTDFKTYLYDNTNSADAWVLNVYQDGAGGNGARIDVDSTDASDFILQCGANGGSTEVLNVMANNRVGIGVTTPDTNMHIHKASAGSVDSYSESVLTLENSGNTALNILSGNANHGQIAFGDDGQNDDGILGYDQATNKMYILTNHSNTKKFVVDASGNIGIGTDSPNSNLHVHTDIGDARITIDSATNSDAQLKFANGGGNSWSVFSDGSATNDPLIFYDYASSTSMMTLNNGKVGIGTVSPQSSLEIELSGDTGTYFEAGGSGNDASDLRHLLMTASTTTNAGDTHAINAESGTGVLLLQTSNTTRLKLDANSRISLSNNDGGSNNTTFGNLAGVALTTNGDRNSLFGHLAGNDISSGAENTLMGYNAGEKITTGLYNTAIGSQAFVTNVDGDFNTAIGYASLYSFEAGSDGHGNNVAIGSNASFHLDSGQNNTMVGTSAGQSSAGTITYTGNTGLGYKSLFAVTTGGYNIAIGNSAGDNITTGSSNIHIGSLAGDNISDAGHIIAIGDSAVRTGTTTTGANGTVAVGSYALEGLTSGARNLAIGYQSLDALTQADDNIAIGYQALTASSETQAHRNIAIGNYALETLNARGQENIAIGFEALETANHADIDANIAIGNYVLDDVGSAGVWACVGIGHNSLSAVNSALAYGTTAMGYYSLTNNTSGAGNTAYGYQSGRYVTTGGSNTFMGFEAGKGVDGTPMTGGNNVAIGQGAGINLQGAVTSNTFVGTASGDVVTTGTNNICIGTLSDPSSATGTNQIVIGTSTTGQSDNSVTLGNASVTDVYMSSDKGAIVHATGLQNSGVKAYRLSGSKSVSADTLTDIFTVGHSHNYSITLWCISNNQNQGQWFGHSQAVYGAGTITETLDNRNGSMSNITVAYNNSGYKLQITVAGVGATVYYTIDGLGSQDLVAL